MSESGRIQYYHDCTYMRENFEQVEQGGLLGAVQTYHKASYPEGFLSLRFSDGICMMQRARDVCSWVIPHLKDITAGCLKYNCHRGQREPFCKGVRKEIKKRKKNSYNTFYYM